jgi:GT2 family glycosyltransferase
MPEPADAVALSVIVPVRDGRATLPRCLAAIFASRGLPPYEVLVVDDGSRDGSAEDAARFPCRLVRLPRGRGAAAARNEGARQARGEVIAFVDADVIVGPGTLAVLVGALAEAPAVFATYDQEPVHRNFATLLYHALSLRSLRDTGERVPVFYSYCAALRVSLFREMGGFDTRFTGATFEDVELGWRLAQRGLYSRHLRDLRVRHAVRYDLPRLARAYYRKSRDLALLLLSSRVATFGGQGWTRRRNWAGLAAAWGTLALAPATAAGKPWAAAWAASLVALLALGGAEVSAAVARRRPWYAPPALACYVLIHVVATAAMASAAAAWLAGRARPLRRASAAGPGS